MSSAQFNLASTPQQQRSINLTPSSDRPSSQDHEPTTPTSPSDQFMRSLGGGVSSMTPIVSSTCASVDSDSDYQGGPGEGSSFSGFGSGNAGQNFSLTTPSRPLSRTSTMSGVSTTATKDGVEGNRIHRFHDPQGYTKWMSSTMPDDISFTSSTNSVVDGSDDGITGMSNDDCEPAGPRDDDSVLDMAEGMAAKARIDDHENGDLDNDHDHDHDQYYDHSGSADGPNTVSASTSNSNSKYQKSNDHKKKLFATALANSNANYAASLSAMTTPEQLDQESTGSEMSYAPTPPNDPSAPPVTLNEKIRLLRTGTVSHNLPDANNKHSGAPFDHGLTSSPGGE